MVVIRSYGRNLRVMRNLQALFYHGRPGGTGYLSILPVDQGVERLDATQNVYLSNIVTVA